MIETPEERQERIEWEETNHDYEWWRETVSDHPLFADDGFEYESEAE